VHREGAISMLWPIPTRNIGTSSTLRNAGSSTERSPQSTATAGVAIAIDGTASSATHPAKSCRISNNAEPFTATNVTRASSA